jgi:ParB-like chromosome segregation protein Spo0J
MKIRELPVDDLVLDPKMNLRDRLDQDTVERYMEAWDRLPPVTVYEVEGEWLLADGIHRHAAAVTLGKSKIKAEVIKGTMEEALDFVAGANLHHGLPLTRAERRRAIELKLRLHHERSDRHLAEELCVGRELVAKIRKQLVETGEIPLGDIRVGSDGKKYPALAKDAGERRPRTAAEGGAEPERPVRVKGGDAPWEGEAAPGRGKGRAPAPWDEETPDARALANAPPIAPSAPTIDEMLQVMARQVMEMVNWTNAEGFLDGYKVASANARGLFQTAVFKLATRADQLRKA